MYYYIVAALLIILVIIVILCASNRQQQQIHSNELPAAISNDKRAKLSVIINTIIPSATLNEMKEYCNKWNYELSDIFTPTTSLVLCNQPTNIRLDQSLDFFRSLLDHVEYIAFYDSTSYFTRGKWHWADIKKHIIPTSYMADGDLDDLTIRNILAHGYPHAVNEGLILSRKYLDLILHGTPLPFVLPHLMPKITAARTPTNVNSRIPKIIHQTFETTLLPKPLKTAVDTWINLNSDYEHRYFSDADRRTFIKQHFDSRVLQAYDKLIPGSYRADLWRYCVIYQNGGAYADIKLGALVSMNEIIPTDADMVLVNDDLNGSMFTSFFAAVPKHPALLACINLTVQRVLAEEYGPYMVYPTGPLAMGAAIIPYYGFENHIPNGHHNNLLVYSHYREDNNIYVKDNNGQRLIKFRYAPSFTEQDVHNITGRPHYKVNWQTHTAYRK